MMRHGPSPRKNRTPFLVPASLAAWVGCLALSPAACSQDSLEPGSLEGLLARIDSTNVVLSWPSDPRESFLVLSRSNAMPETPWMVLANPLRAAPRTNLTTFYHAGGGARAQSGQAHSNLLDLYRVLVLPDFWFNMEGVRLDGGPQQCGADFIPFYYGNPGRDEFSRIFNLHVDLIIDGDRATEEEAIAAQTAVDEAIERVNFGTTRNPRWRCTAGFWLRHDMLANGFHSLQLRTSLHLNNLVGTGEQLLTITNPAVRVWTTNSVTFPNWNSEVGGNMRVAAKSAEPRVNWHIDIRDHEGRLLASKTGTTTNGDIGWTWDLRDTKGNLRGDLDTDPYLSPSVTVWPLDKEASGSHRRDKRTQNADSESWWAQRLGPRLVRKPATTPEEQRNRASSAGPLKDQVVLRPLRLPSH